MRARRSVPPRAWRDRAQDVLDAIAVAEDATADVSFDEFAANRVLVQAVLYSFAIIGEAITGIPEDVRARHPEIPWRQIRETRNIVVHVYFGTDLAIIWDTVQDDLPVLGETLRELLAAEGTEDA